MKFDPGSHFSIATHMQFSLFCNRTPIKQGKGVRLAT